MFCSLTGPAHCPVLVLQKWEKCDPESDLIKLGLLGQEQSDILIDNQRVHVVPECLMDRFLFTKLTRHCSAFSFFFVTLQPLSFHQSLTFSTPHPSLFLFFSFILATGRWYEYVEVPPTHFFGPFLTAADYGEPGTAVAKVCLAR